MLLSSAARTFCLWLGLLTGLMSGFVPGRGLVLCVGADGHVAIEAGPCTGCCEEEHPAGVVERGSCPCIDVPITSVEPLSRAQGSRVLPLDRPTGLVPTVTVLASTLVAPCPPSQRERPRPPGLRTILEHVVLRV